MQFENTKNKGYYLTLKDGYCIIILLVLYGLISFFNLGSLHNPQTFWQPTEQDQEIVLDLGKIEPVDKIRIYAGPKAGAFDISISNDNINFNEISSFNQKSVFFWQDIQLSQSFRYMAITVKEDVKDSEIGSIGEVALYNEEGEKLNIQTLTESGESVLDEPEQIPEQISYLNTTYFDEIYHARTAYEYIHGMNIYEWTHPPLGKLIMTIPIRYLGMTPFSYRLMGNIAGLLMLVIIFIFAKRLFKDTKYAALAMLLFAVDGMHFVQTRIGTVDSFLVLFIMIAYLFMYQYTECNTEKDNIKMHINLGLSGLFLGMAIATKWNGAYAAIGLAIIFFCNFIKRNKEKNFFGDWNKRRVAIILACFIYFIIIPLTVYVLSYIPDMIIRPKYASIKEFIALQQRMYHYHSDLTATHPFGSSWYLWPLGIKPVWYYSGDVKEGMVSTIALHSNPFIWWTGIVAMLYTFINAVTENSKRYVFITVVILVSYLPYIFIPRVMFLYHYFPVVPFMILAIVGALKDMEERIQGNWSKIYAIIAILCFAFFYPIYSGLMIPNWYAALTEWLPMWQLY